MALTSNNPILRDGVLYDRLGANFALSPRWRDDGSVGVSIAVRMTPYAQTAAGAVTLNDDAFSVVFGDATDDAQSDADVAAFLQALEAAAQAFINAKGL